VALTRNLGALADVENRPIWRTTRLRVVGSARTAITRDDLTGRGRTASRPKVARGDRARTSGYEEKPGRANHTGGMRICTARGGPTRFGALLCAAGGSRAGRAAYGMGGRGHVSSFGEEQQPGYRKRAGPRWLAAGPGDDSFPDGLPTPPAVRGGADFSLVEVLGASSAAARGMPMCGQKRTVAAGDSSARP